MNNTIKDLHESNKVLLTFIAIFILIGSYFLAVDNYRNRINILSNSGLRTRGVIDKKILNSDSPILSNRYWEIHYKFPTGSHHYNILKNCDEPDMISGVKNIYDLLSNDYKAGDTVYVLYARDNPSVSDISNKLFYRPKEIDFITAMIKMPVIGLFNILLCGIGLLTLWLLLKAFLKIAILIKRKKKTSPNNA